MEKDKTVLTLEGFSFQTPEEYQKAEEDFKKVKYFNSKVNYEDLRMVQALYEKTIRESIFQTVVGVFYLKELRDYMIKENQALEGLLSPVPVLSKEDTEKNRKLREAKDKAGNHKLQSKAAQLRLSIIMNIVLAIAIVAMFVITLTSGQPNILNYERVLTNRYASWEQELSKREQVVRQKELEIIRSEQP